MRPHIRPAQVGGDPLRQSLDLRPGHLRIQAPVPSAIVKLQRHEDHEVHVFFGRWGRACHSGEQNANEGQESTLSSEPVDSHKPARIWHGLTRYESA